MSASIAFVGAGPTTIYTLQALLRAARAPLSVTVFEAQQHAGPGMPYRPGWNDPAMLSNIASVEIPPVEETLCGWLARQSRETLVRLGVDPDAIDDHAFYPRVTLGAFFRHQFDVMATRARAEGHAIEIVIGAAVADVEPVEGGLLLTVEPRGGKPYRRTFAQVVLATGHQWPDEPEIRPGFYASPWPASALGRIPATDVGIRGTSLTAIDAVVAIANAHGAFVGGEGQPLSYRGNPALRMTMMSRKGLLPEADFHHPLPYQPLSICTSAAIDALVAAGRADLLDVAYGLFRAELAQADPAYARRIGLAELALDDFADRYFADRMAADPFDWAERDLAEARMDRAREHTVAWRYAILRMHEVMGTLAPHLSVGDLERFNSRLKPVFVDDYATVPHLSIERLLALHRAGVLSILPLGEDHRIDTRSVSCGASVRVDGATRHFDAFVDATGQRPLPIDDFPFPALARTGVVRDAAAVADGEPKGIAIDDRYRPVSSHPAAARVYCLSIPFILGRHPFAQGITSSRDMGDVVGPELARAA